MPVLFVLRFLQQTAQNLHPGNRNVCTYTAIITLVFIISKTLLPFNLMFFYSPIIKFCIAHVTMSQIQHTHNNILFKGSEISGSCSFLGWPISPDDLQENPFHQTKNGTKYFHLLVPQYEYYSPFMANDPGIISLRYGSPPCIQYKTGIRNNNNSKCRSYYILKSNTYTPHSFFNRFSSVMCSDVASPGLLSG